MAKLVAFLRAINVGGRTTKMEELRRIFSAAGLSNVETFIASGNVIFDSSSRNLRTLEKKIESTLEVALHYPVGTFIRTMPDVARIAAYQPFQDAASPGHTVFIGFFSSEPTASAIAKLTALSPGTDEFHVNGTELYWLRRSPDTPVGAEIEKVLGMRGTLRNINTVRRIAAKYPVDVSSPRRA